MEGAPETMNIYDPAIQRSDVTAYHELFGTTCPNSNDTLGGNTLYDPWSPYAITPYESLMPELGQERYDLHHPIHPTSNGSRGSPETLFEDAQEIIRSETRLTPGQDIVSNSSFHTAPGDTNDMDPAPTMDQFTSSPVAANDDDVDRFHCDDCKVDFGDAYEHTYVELQHVKSSSTLTMITEDIFGHMPAILNAITTTASSHFHLAKHFKGTLVRIARLTSAISLAATGNLHSRKILFAIERRSMVLNGHTSARIHIASLLGTASNGRTT
jgi:hypothetical protein